MSSTNKTSNPPHFPVASGRTNFLAWHKRNGNVIRAVSKLAAADPTDMDVCDRIEAEAIRIGLIKSSNGRRA